MWIERRRLLNLWDAAHTANEETALATVVRVEGSSYRKPGATMLITRSGRRTGMVSGGCLEAEIARKIWWMTEAGPSVQTFSTSFDEDGNAAYGLGCGGRISLLLERGENAASRIEAMRRSVEQRVASAVVTVLEGESEDTGRRFIVSEDRSRLLSANALPGAGGFHDSPAVQRIAGTTLALRCSSSHQTLVGAGSASVFAEYLGPPPRLFLFGAGDDAQPVAAMAGGMGWDVAVADGRANLATAARFPTAQRTVVLSHLNFLSLGVQAADAAILLTHSYEQDRNVLAQLLGSAPAGSRPGYIGVLGPRRRTTQLVQDVCRALDLDQAIHSSQFMNQLHSPAGLDLGADGPEVVALSIIAEIQAVLEGRSGKPLRLLRSAPRSEEASGAAATSIPVAEALR